jgi:site-specific DNA recombinase
VAGNVATKAQLAYETELSSSYVKRVLKCAVLSPQITENILSGKHRPSLTLQELLQSIPIDWQAQKHVTLS